MVGCVSGSDGLSIGRAVLRLTLVWKGHFIATCVSIIRTYNIVLTDTPTRYVTCILKEALIRAASSLFACVVREVQLATLSPREHIAAIRYTGPLLNHAGVAYSHGLFRLRVLSKV